MCMLPPTPTINHNESFIRLRMAKEGMEIEIYNE